MTYYVKDKIFVQWYIKKQNIFKKLFLFDLCTEDAIYRSFLFERHSI